MRIVSKPIVSLPPVYFECDKLILIVLRRTSLKRWQANSWAKSLFPIDVSVRGVFIICFIVREFFNDDGCAKRRSSFNFFSALREQLRTQSPANILLRLHARFGLAEKPIIGLRCYPREFFCLSQWLGAYAFYPQHIAFGPLVQCGSFPQGAAVFIADRIMLEGKRFWLLLLPALELVSFFCVCECRKLDQRSPPSLVPLVSMLALVFVEGAN